MAQDALLSFNQLVAEIKRMVTSNPAATLGVSGVALNSKELGTLARHAANQVKRHAGQAIGGTTKYAMSSGMLTRIGTALKGAVSKVPGLAARIGTVEAGTVQAAAATTAASAASAASSSAAAASRAVPSFSSGVVGAGEAIGGKVKYGLPAAQEAMGGGGKAAADVKVGLGKKISNYLIKNPHILQLVGIVGGMYLAEKSMSTFWTQPAAIRRQTELGKLQIQAQAAQQPSLESQLAQMQLQRSMQRTDMGYQQSLQAQQAAASIPDTPGVPFRSNI